MAAFFRGYFSVLPVLRKRPSIQLLLSAAFLLLSVPALARRVVSGQVVAAVSDEPVPFASIFIPPTFFGATADLEGKFRLTVAAGADSIAASALGVLVSRQARTAEAAQTVLFRPKAGGGGGAGGGSCEFAPARESGLSTSPRTNVVR